MSIDLTPDKLPLYKFWADYPERDKEYVRWYPPTLTPIEPQIVLDNMAGGPKDLAFYVHVPFCKDICPYCPFNKFSIRSDRAAAFLEGVTDEIRMVGEQLRIRGARITSGYFGGGTPTALELPHLLQIVERIFDTFDVVDSAEVSIEANPDTVDYSKLLALREVGINRISFGVQSFHETLLDVLGRTHGAAGAIQAIELARRAGFENIALDLMYRVPGQSTTDWEEDLDTAIKLGVQHVSTYCLFLDPGTKLYNSTLAGHVVGYPSEETEITMYQMAQERLGAAGYHHYTLNDFALATRESEHHCINWRAPQGSYVGMGPGAFSFVAGASDSYIYCTIHSLRAYAETARRGELPVRLANRLGRAEEMARYMVLGLRCLEVKKEPFQRIHGMALDEVFRDTLDRLYGWGLLDSDNDKIWMTQRGKHYASNVLKAFYTQETWRKPQPIGVELLAQRGPSMASVDLTHS